MQALMQSLFGGGGGFTGAPSVGSPLPPSFTPPWAAMARGQMNPLAGAPGVPAAVPAAAADLGGVVPASAIDNIAAQKAMANFLRQGGANMLAPDAAAGPGAGLAGAMNSAGSTAGALGRGAQFLGNTPIGGGTIGEGLAGLRGMGLLGAGSLAGAVGTGAYLGTSAAEDAEKRRTGQLPELTPMQKLYPTNWLSDLARWSSDAGQAADASGESGFLSPTHIARALGAGSVSQDNTQWGPAALAQIKHPGVPGPSAPAPGSSPVGLGDGPFMKPGTIDFVRQGFDAANKAARVGDKSGYTDTINQMSKVLLNQGFSPDQVRHIYNASVGNLPEFKTWGPGAYFDFDKQ